MMMTEKIEIGLEEEFSLATQMKERFCDEAGREKNAQEAAEIIHKIGIIYRKRSPNKISLIKSAGLLNAAIFRNPSNVSQIKSDLFEICRHTLEQSKAKKQHADLIKKGEEIKISMNQLRFEVKTVLETEVPKIPDNVKRKKVKKLNMQKIAAIQQINKTISEKYTSIMAELSQYCEDVMGKPPCEYAILGMGSLARQEITPYSDFEHIILLFDDLNYESYLEYFKWFSVVFHIVVLNTQETIITSLHINSLNDKNSPLGDWYYDAITKRGISFDGMMPHACKFPLGRQQPTETKPFTTELIKPVSKMLEYLSFETDLKEGYHLADILTKTSFVFGSRRLFKQFLMGSQEYRNKRSETDTTNDIINQVKKDMNNFSTRFRLTNLKTQNIINIKQLVYRSITVFLLALARKYNISENSCFDIIEEMATTKKITLITAEKLKCAVAIACEMRLRVYAEHKFQCDNAIDLKQDGIEQFLNIVGIPSTINYFQIAYCLQCEIAKQLKFTKLHFYSDFQLINITISLAFGLNIDSSSFSEDPQNLYWDSSSFDFDKCIEQLESKSILHSATTKEFGQRIFKFMLKVFNKISGSVSSSSYNSNPNTKQLESIADYLCSTGVYDEALEFYKELLDNYQKVLVDGCDADYEYIASANHQIGFCLFQLHHSTEALKYLKHALQIKQNLTSNAHQDVSISETFYQIGRCLIDLNNYEEAIKNLNRSLQIDLVTTVNSEMDKNISAILFQKGRCHIEMNNHDEALMNLKHSLQIKENTTLNADKDRSIGVTLYELGRCHIDLNNFDEALAILNRSLQIFQNSTLNTEKDISICVVLHEIARCHYELNNYEESIRIFNQSLSMKLATTLNADKDKSIGVAYYELGRCHIQMQNFEEALTNLNRSLQIDQNTTLSPNIDKNISATLEEIHRCHSLMHQK